MSDMILDCGDGNGNEESTKLDTEIVDSSENPSLAASRRNSLSSRRSSQESSNSSNRSAFTTTTIHTNNQSQAGSRLAKVPELASFKRFLAPTTTTTRAPRKLLPKPPLPFYELKWNNYSTVVQNVFRHLLTTGQFSDITLSCETGEIKCHRIVLSACSSYFEQILMDCNVDSADFAVFIRDIELWQLKALVKFMYTGQVKVRQDQVESFMNAAKSFNIKGLNSLPNNAAINKAVSGATQSRVFKHPAMANFSQAPISNSTHKPPSLKYSNSKVSFPGSSSNGNVDKGQASKLNQPLAIKKRLAREVLEFERAQLAQQLEEEDEDFGDVENEMVQIPGSESESENDYEDLNQEHVKGREDGSRRPQPQLANGRIEHDGDTTCMEDGEKLLNDNDEAEDPYMEDMNQMNLPYDIEEVDTGHENELNNPNYPSLELESEPEEEVDDEDEDVDDDESMLAAALSDAPRSSSGSRYYSSLQQEKALNVLRSGASLRQCAKLVGISRRTLAKWKNKGLTDEGGNIGPTGDSIAQGTSANANLQSRQGNTSIPKMGREQRLEKAAKLATNGVTVSQAAAKYNIPRTSLCNYMKKHGLEATKITPMTSRRKVGNST